MKKLINLRKTLTITAALVLGIEIFLPVQVVAKLAHCFCVVSCANLEGKVHRAMVVKEIKLPEDSAYRGGTNNGEINCQNACFNKGYLLTSTPSGALELARSACGIGCPNGSKIALWSAYSDWAYKMVALYGVLEKLPLKVGSVVGDKPPVSCEKNPSSKDTPKDTKSIKPIITNPYLRPGRQPDPLPPGKPSPGDKNKNPPVTCVIK